MAGKTRLKPSAPHKADPVTTELPLEPQNALSQDALDVTNGLASPARRLQHYLGSELGSKFGEDVLAGRWSVRKSVAFVFVTCSLFWAILWLAIRALF